MDWAPGQEDGTVAAENMICIGEPLPETHRIDGQFHVALVGLMKTGVGDLEMFRNSECSGKEKLSMCTSSLRKGQRALRDQVTSRENIAGLLVGHVFFAGPTQRRTKSMSKTTEDKSASLSARRCSCRNSDGRHQQKHCDRRVGLVEQQEMRHETALAAQVERDEVLRVDLVSEVMQGADGLVRSVGSAATCVAQTPNRFDAPIIFVAYSAPAWNQRLF